MNGPGGMRGFSISRCQCLTEQRTEEVRQQQKGRPVPARGGPNGPSPVLLFQGGSNRDGAMIIEAPNTDFREVVSLLSSHASPTRVLAPSPFWDAPDGQLGP